MFCKLSGSLLPRLPDQNGAEPGGTLSSRPNTLSDLQRSRRKRGGLFDEPRWGVAAGSLSTALTAHSRPCRARSVRACVSGDGGPGGSREGSGSPGFGLKCSANLLLVIPFHASASGGGSPLTTIFGQSSAYLRLSSSQRARRPDRCPGRSLRPDTPGRTRRSQCIHQDE